MAILTSKKIFLSLISIILTQFSLVGCDTSKTERFFALVSATDERFTYKEADPNCPCCAQAKLERVTQEKMNPLIPSKKNDSKSIFCKTVGKELYSQPTVSEIHQGYIVGKWALKIVQCPGPDTRSIVEKPTTPALVLLAYQS